MPARSGSSNLMRPFVVLALPGMYLLFKYNQYRQQQMETARRRVTERELTHLNTKILFRSKCLWSDIAGHIKTEVVSVRMFAKKPDDGCRRALVDIPPDEDPVCPGPCERQQTKKEGILHKIKLKVIEGGTNFGTSYRRLTCKKEPICKEIKVIEPKALPLPPQKKAVPMPLPRPGVQVSVLGADTAVGQYVALLLKQCPCIKKLRLYEAQEAEGPECCRKLCKVVRDLQNINTNCLVQAFSCSCCELERCLQSTDIVLMLDGCPNVDLTLEKRFSLQAPLVKHYADCIATECPKAFVIVCASPIDCMVPLVSETLKETGWYDPRKVLGSLAVPEMRASTLAARVLCLEPRYTRVPCVGGTEGGMLVPLFSKAVDCFDFATDKLLNKLEENEPELATSPEEECVICVNAKATMQTSPCGHRVVCRRCFVKTIQMAVSQRLLPLRCVICRAKILRLRQAPRLVTSKSWQVSTSSGKSWGVPGSVSSYSVGARSVPASASLYSVTSGESSLSGVSSVSSNSGASVPGTCSTKLCGGAKCGGACLGAVPRNTASAPPRARQPASNSLRRSQHQSMKARLQEYNVHSYTGGPAGGEPSGRLPPIREFQREFREGRRESASATASASTRIRCAQKIVTQLETSPQKNAQHFFRPLKPSNKDDPPNSRDQSKETEPIKENPKAKPKKDDKKDDQPDDKHKKDEANDNRKNETAEKKKEEKLKLKAEKEAKKEAKQQAKEEERQAKLLAKEEEKQAKLLAKEEKKKAKKEAKLAAQAEKEKNK